MQRKQMKNGINQIDLFYNGRGITLIALVITIIVLLILASVTISTFFGENGIITRAVDARFQTNLATLKEEIDIYRVGEQLDNKTGIDQYPVIKEETLESVDKSIISDELKQKMVRWATTAGKDEIATIDTIDYSKFYKLDKEKIQSANNFKGDLYLIALENDYKVISIEGEEYNHNTIYVLIPLNDIADPEYIAVANNIYKLYGNGTVKVVGELTANSGMTGEEEEQLTGIKELDIEEIAKGTEMKIDKNVDTDDEIAKKYGVKKIYMSCGTAYVIDAENNLWAWGDNQYNKLGQGNSYLVSTPIKIFENAKNVWAGALNTYVLDTNNQLWGAGANANGELGQRNTNIYNNFVKININGLDLNTTNIIKIEVSNYVLKGNALIVCDNGKIYGCGGNDSGQLGIGNAQNQTTFIDLTQYDEKWSNVKDLYSIGICSFVLTNDNVLYGSGYNRQGGLGIDTGNQNVSVLTKITDNIEEINVVSPSEIIRICKSIDGTISIIGNGRLSELSDTKGKNTNFISNSIIIDGKIYKINSSKTGVELYSDEYNVESKMLEGRNVTQFIADGKLYVAEAPDILTPNSKSIYQLKQVFNNAIFMQGKGTNISLVDANGNIYENLTNQNTEVTNVKKLVTSAGARYALTNTGELYAKGINYTGMWGNLTQKNNYVQVTKDGTTPFDNIKDIYTTNAIRESYASSAVFITEDNKIYWAGSTSVTPFPNIRGDIQATGMGKITAYPEEVSSNLINEIKDKIVDIKMNYINSGGIIGKNGLILTEDGKVYTYANEKNMTGLNKITSDYEEIKVKEGETAKEIETQDGLSLVLLNNGEVYGWGYNTYGILGEEYEVGGVYPTPVKLKIENVRTMTLGDNFAIFETFAGEVYGIGLNDYGQLGTGNNIGANNFVRCEELEK